MGVSRIPKPPPARSRDAGSDTGGTSKSRSSFLDAATTPITPSPAGQYQQSGSIPVHPARNSGLPPLDMTSSSSRMSSTSGASPNRVASERLRPSCLGRPVLQRGLPQPRAPLPKSPLGMHSCGQGSPAAKTPASREAIFLDNSEGETPETWLVTPSPPASLLQPTPAYKGGMPLSRCVLFINACDFRCGILLGVTPNMLIAGQKVKG